MMEAVREAVRQVASGMVTRGKVRRVRLGPQRAVLQVAVFAGEVKEGVELLLPPGMSAVPLGGDVLLFQVNGRRDHLVALVDDPATRIADLKTGEFGFRDRVGQQVVFRADHLEIITPPKVVITATGDVVINSTGNVVLHGAARRHWRAQGGPRRRSGVRRCCARHVNQGPRAMTAPTPTATLRPTDWAYESVGDLRLDTIRGIRLWLRRSGNHAALTLRHGERWIGAGTLDQAFRDTWRGRLTVHGVEWLAEAIRDERSREWRITLTVPAEAPA